MKAAKILINRRALRNNLKRLRELAPTSKLLAIVKANAYGHGLLEIAKTLPDVDAFGVARLEEAMCLRAGRITKPILLLEGFLEVSDLSNIVEQHLHIAVHNEEQLRALELTPLNKPINVWMKLDTGMHRLGVRPEMADIFYQRLCQCNNVYKPINIISHFSHTDELEYDIIEKQLNIFNAFCIDKPGKRSIAASSGILFWSQSHLDWVRPGIILYGISPFKKKPWGSDFGFQPVMSLISYLIAIREHKAGEPVGYGGKWISKRDTYLGVVAMGYGDGYPRAVPSGTPVLINGCEVPIVGSVSMDMVCVDLGPYTLDRTGDPVIFWGEGLSVERVAQKTNISAYELITRLTSRVEINFIN